MGELAKEYEGKVQFELVSPQETQAAAEDLERFGFTEASHGLVAFDASGEPQVMIPGHSFGREEIVGAIEKVLGER